MESSSLSQRLLLILPGFLVLLLVPLSAAIMPASLKGIAPAALLPALYFWGVFRAGSVPLLFVFLLGLLQDVISGTPLGVMALAALLTYGLARRHQRFYRGSSFISFWIGFILVFSFLQLGIYLLLCAYYGAFFPLAPVLLQWAFTVSLYPFLHFAFHHLLMRLPARHV